MLKDIILVTISAFWFNTPVTPLQLFGYTIALCGMMYYKLGADKLKEYGQEAHRTWAEFGNRSPAKRRAALIGSGVILIILVVMLMGRSYDPNQVMRDLLPSHGTNVGGTTNA